MDTDMKKLIDRMSYRKMLFLNRFEPSGSQFFMGETGTYFDTVMKTKRKDITDEEHTIISKDIGWEK